MTLSAAAHLMIKTDYTDVFCIKEAYLAELGVSLLEKEATRSRLRTLPC